MDVDLPKFIKQDAIVDPGRATNNNGKIMKRDYVITYKNHLGTAETETYHSQRRASKRIGQLLSRNYQPELNVFDSKEGWYIGQE